LSDPPPALLVRILAKFKLVPFREFDIKSVCFDLESVEFNSDSNVGQLFPLSCSKLRDYIRAFCWWLDLRTDKVDFAFKNLADNKLVRILEAGGTDDTKYDANKPGMNSDGEIVSPLFMAMANDNMKQIASLIKRGANPTSLYIDLLLCSPERRHIIWDNIELFKRKDIIEIVLQSKSIWKGAPKSFFHLDDFNYALRRFYNNADGLLKHLMGIFPKKYAKVEYYDYVCDKEFDFMEKLFKMGFSPDTHFSHVINLSWVDGIKLCLAYGAEIDAEGERHLKRHNNPAVKKLFSGK